MAKDEKIRNMSIEHQKAIALDMLAVMREGMQKYNSNNSDDIYNTLIIFNQEFINTGFSGGANVVMSTVEYCRILNQMSFELFLKHCQFRPKK